jgi:pyroglutamyl-peptidase
LRFLLTAFEPFDRTGLNASLEGCRAFMRDHVSGWDVRFLVLPVRYGPDTELVEAAVAEESFDVLLHTGQAEAAREIRVERVAVNVRYPEDDPGRHGDHTPIDPDGPTALLSTLPVDAVAEGIRAEGIPAVVSNHAGIYLCNHVLYRSLQRADRDGLAHRVGFLHIPPLPEQRWGPDHPVFTAEEVAAGLQGAFECLAGTRARAPFRGV